MGWLSDTWDEIITGGKKKTPSYDSSYVPPKRREGLTPSGPMPSPKPTPTPTPTPSPPMSRWGTPPPGSPSNPIDVGTGPRAADGARPGTRPFAVDQAALDAARARENAARVAQEKLAAVRGTKPSSGLPSTDKPSRPGEPAPAPGPVPKKPDVVEREQADYRAREGAVREEIRASGTRQIASPARMNTGATTKELSEQEWLALTPRQRAAVQFNTELVSASRKDLSEGGSSNTVGLLEGLGVEYSPEELNSFLQLDAAITASVLDRLGDSTLVETAPTVQRYTSGNPAARPKQVQKDLDVLDLSGRLADAMSLRLANATGQLGQDTKAPPPVLGMGNTADDEAVRTAYNYMIDSSVEFTTDDIVEGINMMNEARGTSITPEDVWAFLGRQLDAVDYGRVRNSSVPMPSPDPKITPLSAAEIRRRYGF